MMTSPCCSSRVRVRAKAPEALVEFGPDMQKKPAMPAFKAVVGYSREGRLNLCGHFILATACGNRGIRCEANPTFARFAARLMRPISVGVFDGSQLAKKLICPTILASQNVCLQ